ncbi:MAG: polymerase [Segetibacter sp.]|nr:polymerase [Segetibacter sp.]
MQNKRLFLFDVMPLLYRAHFATMGKTFGTTTGIDTRTTLVFYNYIFQVLTEEKPDAVAAALDSKPKGRVEVSATYKANREKMPSEIGHAFPYAMKLLNALQIPVLKEEGLEADDVIASLAKKGAAMGYTVYIVSPDKDFAQLVTEYIFLFRPAYKGVIMETLNVEGVKNKYGVPPNQIADYLALRGDSVDNIIGVKGIGDKTAAQLLSTYHSVEALIEQVESIKQPKIKESIIAYKDQLLENKQLAVLTGDVDVSVEWDDIVVKKPDESMLLPLLDELQFVKIRERLAKLKFITAEANENDAIVPLAANVMHLNFEEFTKLISPKEIAVAFSQTHPDRLFLIQAGDKTIHEIVVADDAAWKEVIQFLDKDNYTKVGWHLKPLLKVIIRLGITLKTPWIDLTLAAYLLEPDAKIEWLFIKDKYQLTAFIVEAPYAYLSYLPSLVEAHEKIMIRIKEMELSKLFFKIELPLQSVLALMELYGIRIDLDALTEIDKVLSAQLKDLEQSLYEIAGNKFNINSPSKTADILQTFCEASELKKTKGGQVSTAEPHLADLAPKYPFVANLLNYRKLNKIITTYVYSLPRYVDARTNKIHPTFTQLISGTGRIGCIEPNLQNLPIRSDAGREVRKAIVPSAEGYSILSIDFNQVELRLLAALSEDKVMIETFKTQKDIHTITASRVFNVHESAVTKDLRSKAKGVNFGIAYGITPWGLSTRLRIPQKEAKEIIEAYFEEFSSVKEYLERSINESRERGYTKTKYGRIRYIEGIDSKNGTTRKIAERVAVNAPIQGLAADIIKEAMVSIHQYIVDYNLRSRLILQVHDELVFDAAEDELHLLVPEVIRIMEMKVDLLVRLKVNVTVGQNWLEQVEYEGAKHDE